MPYIRRYNKQPSSYNRMSSHSNLSRSYKRVSKYATAANAKRALDLALSTRKLFNVEYKQLVTQAIATALPQTGTIVQLTNIAQGDTTFTRDGSQIKGTSYTFNYLINQSGNATNTQCRVLLIQDKQTNQVIYTPADVFFDATATDILVSPYNVDNSHRFRILYDRYHAFTDTGHTNMVKKHSSPINMLFRYDANAGDITDLTQNSLSLLVCSNEPTNVPVITFNFRLRFIDN